MPSKTEALFESRPGTEYTKPEALPPDCFQRDARGSLEIFGGKLQNSTPLFASPAWHDALRAAESLMHRGETAPRTDTLSRYSSTLEGAEGYSAGSKERVVAVSSLWRTASRRADRDKALPRPRTHVKHANPLSSERMPVTLENGTRSSDCEFSLDRHEDTSEVLMQSVEAPKSLEMWQGVLNGGVSDEEGAPARDTAKGGSHRYSVSSSEVSDETISERAAQWGYGVNLKPGSAEFNREDCVSWRTSTCTSTDGSSGGESSSSQTIPRVSKHIRDTITSFNLAFVVCDATSKNPTFPVLYASSGFFKMTGYSSEDVIGKNCRFLQGPSTNLKEVAAIAKALRDGDTYSGKIFNYRKDGTTFWNVLTMSPIKNENGEVIKYLGMQAVANERSQSFNKDTTEEKKSVSQAMQRKKMLQSEGNPQRRRSCAKSFTEVELSDFSLPPSKEEYDRRPRMIYRYSMTSKARESAADWEALAQLRSEILAGSTFGTPLPEPKETRGRGPGKTKVLQFFRKLNPIASDREREVRYVQYGDEKEAESRWDDLDHSTRPHGDDYSDSCRDRPQTWCNSHQTTAIERPMLRVPKPPSMTYGGKSQFIIVHS